MAIEININQKIYHIGVAKGEEDKIISFSKVLNTKIDNFKNQDPTFFMGLNNERLLLFMALLMVEEELDYKRNLEKNTTEAKKALKQLEEQEKLAKDELVKVKKETQVVDNSAMLHIEQLKAEINALKNQNTKLIAELKEASESKALKNTASDLDEEFTKNLQQAINKKIAKVKEHIEGINASISTIKNNI
jgi:cell division protein ZapA (FtsZ GTPase activity inhibitor)